MATEPPIYILPTVNGTQITGTDVVRLGVGLNTALLTTMTTGALSSSAVFDLPSLTAGQVVGMDWGSPAGYPPSGPANSYTAHQIILVLRPK